MNVITKATLQKYMLKFPEASNWLNTWYEIAEKANWTNFNDVKLSYPSADQVGDDRVVFNVKGNKFRLIVRFSFQFKVLQIKWFGSHKEYDRIDVLTVQPD